jgi:ABC-2 type transport system ATP-binding protein
MLTASGLTRRFGERVAVEDVSFELASGEIFALLGPNGAGKTTTLRMLAGLIEPTSGAVRIEGEPLTRATSSRLRGRVGFLTEAPGLWDRLSVRQNLMVYARLHGLPAPQAAVEATLDVFGMKERAGDRAAQLSKGLKQRVALARTLIHNPPIVLLDEPTSGLDPESARDVRTLILRLRDEGRTVLVSTHNLDEVDRVADRVAVLRTSLIAVDTPDALRARLFGARVRIGVRREAQRYGALLRQSGTADVRVEDSQLSIGLGADVTTPSLIRRLVEAGADIDSVVPEEPPLEEVYLRLLHQERTRR